MLNVRVTPVAADALVRHVRPVNLRQISPQQLLGILEMTGGTLIFDFSISDSYSGVARRTFGWLVARDQ